MNRTESDPELLQPKGSGEKTGMLLNPVISKLTGKLVVLASASPRRLEILTNVGLRFEVVPSWFKETLDKRCFKPPYEYAVETARQKALEVAKRMPCKHLKTPDLVIGADTIVTIDGMILEKPVDKHDAYRMLSRLSGKEHSVFTGVALVLCHEQENKEIDYQMVDFYEETKVKFADLSEDMLWEYINSGEPMDKAGGYGIQALGGMLVEYVHGDFLNVVGFPLNRFCKQLDLLYNPLSSSSSSSSSSPSPTSPTLTHPPPPPPPVNLGHSPPAPQRDLPASAPPDDDSSSGNSDDPSATQAHHNLADGPFSSPAHKVVRKGSESGLGDSSWTLVNSLSKHSVDSEAELQDCAEAALPPVTSRGPVNEPGVVENEDFKEHLRRMIGLIDGFKASKAMFTASKMRVFDVLHSRPGLYAEEVALEIEASARGTECLLEACVSLGLLESKERARQKPAYKNTDLAERFLTSDSPVSLQGYIQHCNELVWPLHSHMDNAVRDGTSQHEMAFGKKSSNTSFQDANYNRHEVKLRFMNAMHSVARVTGRAVATAFDLSPFKTACDLGGCTGAMAYEFAKACPGLVVTVLDLPGIVKMSGHFRPLEMDKRVSFVAGDFFKDALPKADLYILARILHDWSDDSVHALLRRISDACMPGCGLLLSEIFLDEDRRGPSRGLLQALGMSEGRQRSASEYSRLLQSHGFSTAHVKYTDNLLDAMLCIRDC